ncbi:DNA-binding GntR family transcriptional regulator [Kineosphaera limosa]|uniref:Putative GntR family transcriptional regulator n=1 Tax=Kineosphaera limosa NBRC 100340 TaxID=1184609 RepID=K6WW47_9MICO|nr:GntR family transcriptional regulator [Kineosphaera limosa]NYE02008.1 DNA-binding GntR family transcriptional regulator [Kineosphaera limosa]GAB98061.1 putative GntR family transcriptional regulator [Kineosphaera limosa NBRC 100340]
MSQATGSLFETKSDFAYRLVRDRILSGQFEPGAVMQQRDLAAELGISTTPLREALRRLKSEGLVELDSHRDARVTPLRAEEARDLLELRRALEPVAVGLAADRRTSADIEAMRAALAALEPLPADPSVEQLVRHREFHGALYRASHNQAIIEALDQLWDKQDRYRRLALQTDPDARVLVAKAQEHRDLLDHVVAGDAGAAADLMARHIESSHGAHALRRLGGAQAR